MRQKLPYLINVNQFACFIVEQHITLHNNDHFQSILIFSKVLIQQIMEYQTILNQFGRFYDKKINIGMFFKCFEYNFKNALNFAQSSHKPYHCFVLT